MVNYAHIWGYLWPVTPNCWYVGQSSGAACFSGQFFNIVES